MWTLKPINNRETMEIINFLFSLFLPQDEEAITHGAFTREQISLYKEAIESIKLQATIVQDGLKPPLIKLESLSILIQY